MSLKQNDKKIKSEQVSEATLKIKRPLEAFWSILLVIIATSLLVWLIYQLVALNAKYNLSNIPITIEKSQRVGEISQEVDTTYSAATKTSPKNFYIAASKSGTKYYYQNCAGLSRIKPENLTFFASESLAERAGYTLAKNCQKP
jgi:hypothetical protein